MQNVTFKRTFCDKTTRHYFYPRHYFFIRYCKFISKYWAPTSCSKVLLFPQIHFLSPSVRIILRKNILLLLGSFKCVRQQEKSSASTRCKCFGTLIRRLKTLQGFRYKVFTVDILKIFQLPFHWFLLQIACFLNENIW